MNSFHWHLTDDQGWRIEIKKYPRLTEVGAWRSETLVGHCEPTATQDEFDGMPHGGFYTQDDSARDRGLCRRARFITVVPEIEMPGHAQAAIAAYPELGNTGEPCRRCSTDWGIHYDVFSADERARCHFLQNVLTRCWSCSPASSSTSAATNAPRSSGETARCQARMQRTGPEGRARAAELLRPPHGRTSSPRAGGG